ncbi:MAG: M48 family metalloprotease [Desulfobacter sp.]|nr:M48 family metalloprotease [Desulfobacter sp.]WDP86659.1 MAG: M48 family metalloprotease [Desulfobacter sp.]
MILDNFLTHSKVCRRDFLKFSAMAALSGAGIGGIFGCAVDPVTGQQQLMLMSQEQEMAIDRQQSPFQFSSDYGVTQEPGLNEYISSVGKGLLKGVHRPAMNYNFQCVNATYINAYAFPGGSIAATRGILLKLENEGELAALLGHELGHVNARHSAEQASKGTISSLLIGSLSAIASTQNSGFRELTQQLGALSQGLFLSKYSRSNENEADALGQLYMTRAGYSSKGFVGLMNMLNSLNKSHGNSVQMLFATHPMSTDRLEAAIKRDDSEYAGTKDFPLHRERYMDKTAGLRKKAKAIVLMQQGETYLSQKKYDKAQQAFGSAIKKADQDYTAHLLMAKCMLTQKKSKSALSYADKAKQLYPKESQGYYVSGLAGLGQKKYTRAYEDFKRCDALLPGNPQLTFYQGFTLDKTSNQKTAADLYIAYLKQINYASNQYSQYAYKRLKAWGYAK